MAEFGTFTSGSVLTAAELNAAGAWTSFTPSWTNLTVGNGVVSAAYSKFNKILFVRVYFDFGSTSSLTSNLQMTLPASLTQNTASQEVIGHAQITKTGVFATLGLVAVNTSTTVKIQTWLSSGTYPSVRNVEPTVPVVFASDTNVSFEFTTRLA
jgi:hypothetical protein